MKCQIHQLARSSICRAGGVTLSQLCRIRLADSSTQCLHRMLGAYDCNIPVKHVRKERDEGNVVFLFWILWSADMQTELVDHLPLRRKIRAEDSTRSSQLCWLETRPILANMSGE